MAAPLEGIRVLDLTRALAGPFCTVMLADMGADVVKVETPGKGDDSRGWGPPFQGGESSYFLSLNRNKRSITLNLKQRAGQQVFRRLLERADILIENFSPGTMERLGFSYETVRQIRPDIIYCSISGFGQIGPSAQKPAYDLILQGMGGIMSITGPVGGPPTKVGVAIADTVAGMFAAYAIALALYHRQLTGQGQYIDTSLLDGMVAILTFQAARYFATGIPPAPEGNRHPNIAPYESLATADGYINVAVGNEAIWSRFCAALGLEQVQKDPRFATNAQRLAHRDELVAILEERTRQYESPYLLQLLEEAGVPAGPIRNLKELFEDPQVEVLGLKQQVQHPSAGTITLTGIPYRFSATPGSIRRPPPRLGEHTIEVLSELGYTQAEIERLREEGAL
jgi:crotonobetainyl-CoA:carnitine CoA-transferase CaiB-like acyl-CoA transferase